MNKKIENFMLIKKLYDHTPIIKQYLLIKRKYPKMFLFFQIGDFYEFFYEDAKNIASILKITLTKKGSSSKEKVPMAGFPCIKVNYYSKKLLKLGKSIVICNQVNSSALTNKTIIQRKVTQIITPGTIVDEDLLDGNKDNLLVSVFEQKNRFGYSTLNLCLGKLEISEFDNVDDFLSEIERTDPEEILCPENFSYIYLFSNRTGINKRSIFHYSYQPSLKKIVRHFLINKKQKIELEKLKLGVCSAGTILQYIKFVQKTIPSHIQFLQVRKNENKIYMNASTRKNLEISHNLNNHNKKNSLLSILDDTSTLMGKRMLKRWLCSPSCRVDVAISRHNGVYALLQYSEQITPILNKLSDLERIITRISLLTANPKDLLNLRNFLFLLPKLKKILAKISEKKIQVLNNLIFSFKSLFKLIKKSIQITPSDNINNGNVISIGFDKELDKWRDITNNSYLYLKKVENKQKKKFGFRTLKIGFNYIIGYYLQISKKDVFLTPKSYIRKQTLKHVERYTIPEIENFQKTIENAKFNALFIEKKIYVKILKKIFPFLKKLKKTACSIAELDVLNNFSRKAITLNYVRPVMTEKQEIKIVGGRHPVVESSLNTNFISNSTHLSKKKKFLLITGPNMGGKSTYMRQVAIIVILSYIGSFVPAKKAYIGLVDKIFTRIGASDDLYSGKSTFMVEMLETAHILQNATKSSLVLIDELGRGTSPQEGLSIAWSCASCLAKTIKSFTLFSTHYSELHKLEKEHKNIKNIYFDSVLNNNKIIFKYVLKKGFTNKSYGIPVALLSGFPKKVIEEAKKKLKKIKNRNKKYV